MIQISRTGPVFDPRKRRCLTVLLLFLASAGCVESEPDVLSMVADSVALDLLTGPPEVAGLVIAVGRGDDVVFNRAYGVSDPASATPLDAATPLRISSITKQFTAAAVLRLVEDGAIELEAPIAQYLPEFAGEAGSVTVRDLLSHTSGIPNYSALLARAGRAPAPRAEVLDTLRSRPTDFAAGESFRYSNSNYYLLGLILEAVTGESYAAHLQANLFDPVGLEYTLYCRLDGAASLIGYRASAEGLDPVELRDSIDYLGGSGGLCSTAGDLVRWQLELASGDAVGPTIYERMTTPGTLASGEATTYGMGAFLDELEGSREILHSGSLAGFNARIASYPEEGLAVAVLANTSTPKTEAVLEAVARAALGLPRVVPTDLPLSADEVARYSGTYDLGAIQLRVFEREGRLILQPAGQAPARLLHQGDHTFLAEVGGGARIEFDVDGGRVGSLTLHQGSRPMVAGRIEP